MSNTNYPDQSECITIMDKKQIRHVHADEILKLESARNYTVFFEKSGEQHVMCRTIGDVLRKLNSNENLKNVFFRVSKTTAVNLREIKQYKPGRGGMVVLSNEAAISVAYRRKTELLKVLKKLK